MTNEKVKINIQDIDTESGLGLCDDDFDVYINSLRIFAGVVPETLNKIKTVSADTIKEYAVNAHGIKGMSQYIGAMEASKQALKAEQLAKSQDVKGTIALNDSFIEYMEKLIGNIKSWLLEYDEKPV